MTVIPEIIPRLVAQASGLPPSAIAIVPRPRLEYQSNDLYGSGWMARWIAKHYSRPNEAFDAPLREHWALERLAALDIAPQPVFYDPALGPLVIYEYMEGEMWDRARPGPAALARLAETWLQVCAVPADWPARGLEAPPLELAASFQAAFQDYAAWAAAEFPPGQRAAEICLGLLASRLPAFRALGEHSPRLCFCKSDPRFANVIQRPDGRLGLVDWEDSGLHDPAKELADMLTHPNQEDLLSWDDWQAFAQPYTAACERQDPHFAGRIHLWLAVFPIFWLSIQLRRGLKLAAKGELAGWLVNDLPVNARLALYLARALAWPDMEHERHLQSLAGIKFFPKGKNRPHRFWKPVRSQ
jgi:hypothetical protein